MRRIVKQGLAATVAALVVAVTLVVGSPQKAWAAEFTPTNIEISVDRTSAYLGYDVTANTELSFDVPNDTPAGATFELTLPDLLVNWQPTLEIRNGSNGPVVFDVSIAGSPGVATFTLTEEGADTENLHVTAFFAAKVDTKTAGSHDLVYSYSGGTTVTAGTITITKSPSNPVSLPTAARKSGWFSRSYDQCRTNPERCIVFRVETTLQPTGVVTLVDKAGPNWKFNCEARVSVDAWTFNSDGSRTGQNKGKVDASALDCSDDLMVINYDTAPLALEPNQTISFTIAADARTLGGSGLVTYANTADLTIAEKVSEVSVAPRSSYAGGTATGDAITIIKRDEAGHDANTQEEAVNLPDGTTALEFTVINSGTTTLTDLNVSDMTTLGDATVSNLSCDFSPLGGPETGTSWSGSMAKGKSFVCTAELAGVVGPHTDVATVTAMGNGQVSDTDPYNAINPKMNLVIAKELVTEGPFNPGQTVEFELTPSNEGPSDAAAGWSVQDVLPTGLELEAMSGEGYQCSENTCVAADGLAAGESGPVVTVTATIAADATGTLHNVAFVAPAEGDIDETNPLEVPDRDTNTDTTATDNDSQADLTLAPAPAPTPSTAEATPTLIEVTDPAEVETSTTPVKLPMTDGAASGLGALLAIVTVGITAVLFRRHQR